MSKQNSMWKTAGQTVLKRADTLTGKSIYLERGVNFFVLALERAGATPMFSCEGHPLGFYVLFRAPYKLALDVARTGYFTVDLNGVEDCWRLSLAGNEYAMASPTGEGYERLEQFSKSKRDELLEAASKAWAAAEWFVTPNVRANLIKGAADET